MTTAVLYATSESGVIQSDSTVYLTARIGNNLNARVDYQWSRVGQYYVAPDYAIWESFIEFDLSSLSGTVSAAVLSLSTNNGTDATTPFTIRVRDDAYGATLTTADWVAGASLSATGTLRAHLASSSWSSVNDTYNDLDNDAMPAYIEANVGGTARLIVYSSLTEAGTPATTSEFVYFGGQLDPFPPRLTVTYTATVAATQGRTMIGGGFF